MAKLILVTGATGNQGEYGIYPYFTEVTSSFDLIGGAVAKLLLQHPNEYRVRCLTRNPTSSAAKALAEQGAEVVQGDLSNLKSLSSAMEGCWGVFAVTNFYDSVTTPHLSFHEAQISDGGLGDCQRPVFRGAARSQSRSSGERCRR